MLLPIVLPSMSVGPLPAIIITSGQGCSTSGINSTPCMSPEGVARVMFFSTAWAVEKNIIVSIVRSALLIILELSAHLATEFAAGLCTACALGSKDVLSVIYSLESCILLAAECYLNKPVYKCGEVDSAVLPKVEG